MILFNNLLYFQITVIVLSNVFQFSHESHICRITKGTHQDLYDLQKFVVSIQRKQKFADESKFGWTHFCGGSIVSENKILTAAHCLYNRHGKVYKPKDIVVVTGLTNRFNYTKDVHIEDVASIKPHKSFGSGKTFYADIGFIILKEKISIDCHRDILPLPITPPVDGELCTTVGWGKLFYKGPTPDKLNFVDIKVLSNKHCKWRHSHLFTPGMICAADVDDWGKDACSGDSGGPMICAHTLVGITSWGSGCGFKYSPGVYTDVYFFRNWISSGQKLCKNLLIMMILITTNLCLL